MAWLLLLSAHMLALNIVINVKYHKYNILVELNMKSDNSFTGLCCSDRTWSFSRIYTIFTSDHQESHD